MNKQLEGLKKKLEAIEENLNEFDIQIGLQREKALSFRQERYSLMKDFTKNKDKVFDLDAQEKKTWDSVNSLRDMKEEVEKEIEQQKHEIVEEAVKLRQERYSALKIEGEKVEKELVEKRFKYLVELEKAVKEANQKSFDELAEIDVFIMKNGTQKQKRYADVNKRNVVSTGYGRRNNPPHFVDTDDYMWLFSPEENQLFTYRLYKLTGEIELDGTAAQKKYREAVVKKGGRK